MPLTLFLLPSDGLPLTRTREGRGHLLGYQSDRPRHPRLLRKKPTFIFPPKYLKTMEKKWILNKICFSKIKKLIFKQFNH